MSCSCTGYTSLIQSGKVTTATDFLKTCLRNFGVLAELRDERLSPDIPREIKKDDFYAKRLVESKKKLECLLNTTDEEWKAMLADDIKDTEEALANEIREVEEFAGRLNAIKAEIDKWECDPLYKGVKEFALEQIRLSMPSVSTWNRDHLERLKAITFEEYRDERIRFVRKDIDMYEESAKAESNRGDTRNAFLEGFWRDIEKLGGQ